MPDRALVLVDGSNVLHAAGWASDADGWSRLVTRVGSWAARHGHRAVVVFDGGGGSAADVPGVVRVLASGGVPGDDVLEREALRAHAAGTAYWVVSDDRAVRDVAGAHARRVVSSGAFLAELAVPEAAAARPVDDDGASRLDARIDPATRDRLEQLRRGSLEP